MSIFNFISLCGNVVCVVEKAIGDKLKRFVYPVHQSGGNVLSIIFTDGSYRTFEYEENNDEPLQPLIV